VNGEWIFTGPGNPLQILVASLPGETASIARRFSRYPLFPLYYEFFNSRLDETEQIFYNDIEYDKGFHRVSLPFCAMPGQCRAVRGYVDDSSRRHLLQSTLRRLGDYEVSLSDTSRQKYLHLENRKSQRLSGKKSSYPAAFSVFLLGGERGELFDLQKNNLRRNFHLQM
jgi:hypothetical protein